MCKQLKPTTFIVFLIFIATLTQVQAQESKLDSLKILLSKSISDEKRVDILSDISVLYFNQQIYYDSAYYYTDQSLRLSKERGFTKSTARAYSTQAMVNTVLGDYDEALKSSLLAKEIFEELEDTLNLSIINSGIGALYYNTEDFNRSKLYFEKAIKLAEKKKDTIGIIIDNINLGDTDYSLGNYKQAKRHLERARELMLIKDVEFAEAYIYYGKVLLALDEVDVAEVEGLKGLELSKANKVDTNLEEASELMYMVYEKKGDFEKALVHHKNFSKYNQSLEAAKQLNNREKLLLNLNLAQKEKELKYISQREIYKYIIAGLVGIGLILLTVLVFRQLKVTRMTKEIHNIQRSLVSTQFLEREEKKKTGVMSSFNLTKLQDKELKNPK